MKSIFEQMGGTYRRVGDYYIPDLALPDEPEYQIGKYGRMRERYLKEHRRAAYAELKLSGRLDAHLAEIEQTCNKRMDAIVAQTKKREGVTEALKASDQMAWIGAVNNVRSRAEEIVLAEVVFIEAAGETIEAKILRIMKNEAGKADTACGIINVPQMDRPT